MRAQRAASKPPRLRYLPGLMIKLLRSGGASIGVWIILGVLALAFGLTFGVPSDSISLGSSAYATAFGDEIRNEDWAYQQSAVQQVARLPEDQRFAAQIGVREEIFESILERKVLADVADEVGLAASTRDAELLTVGGNMIVLGQTIDWLGDLPFNYENLFKQNWVPRFRTNEKGYLERQRQEILARNVRDLIATTIVVPEDEVRKAYEADVDRLSLRYVRFEGLDFAALVDPTPAEIESYVAENEEALDAKFAGQGPRFTKLPKQSRLRFLKVNRPAKPADDADAEAKAAFADADKKALDKIAEAQKRLAAGEDFRRVARELSDDAPTARGGGDYGWVSLEGTGSGLEPVVDEAAQALEPGKVSARIDGQEGYYLVQVVGTREGDVPKQEAFAELAEEAVKRERGNALAKQAAEEALLNVKGGKTLAELFPPEGAADPLADGDDPSRPKMQITGPFKRGDQVPGLGLNPELTNAAWSADAKAEVLEQVFEVPTGFVVAGIESRSEPSDSEYAERRAELATGLAQQRALKVTAHFAKRRCTDALGKGEIKGNDALIGRLMTYDIEGDEPMPDRIPYRMCDRVGNGGGMLRLPVSLSR